MTTTLYFVSEEHIGLAATAGDGHRVVELMRCLGWPVVYGDQPWQFENEEKRLAFEQVFQWTLVVLTAEKETTEQSTWETLAKQRLQLDETLRPLAQQLEQKRPWPGYWRWLIATPSDVILTWLETENKKGAASS